MRIKGGNNKISSIFFYIFTVYHIQAGPVVRPSRMVREIYPEVEQEIPDSSQSQGCIVGDILYPYGTPIPSESPCLKCSCSWGGVRCDAEVCSAARGCRAVALQGRCCPAYLCECLHQGKAYANGERLPQAPGQECSVCYCRGGHVQCAEVGCYTRDDCEPKYVKGECCPKYDHCPPRDSLSDRNLVSSSPSLQSLDTEFMSSWSNTKYSNSSTFTLSGLGSESTEEGSGDSGDELTMSDEPKRISTPVTFSIREIESKGNGKKPDENVQIIKADQSIQNDAHHPQITIQEITPPRSEFIPPQSVSVSPINPVTYKPSNLSDNLHPMKAQEQIIETTQDKNQDTGLQSIQIAQTLQSSLATDYDQTVTSPSSLSTLTDSVNELADTESYASEKTEIYDRPPPVLRIGDQLLFIKQGQLIPEKDASTPSPVITLIGAEGLQIGLGSGEGLEHEMVSIKNGEITSTSEISIVGTTEKFIESSSESDVSTSIPTIEIISSEEITESVEATNDQNDTSGEFITINSSSENIIAETSSTISPKPLRVETEQLEYIPEENPYYPAIPEDIMILGQDELSADDTSEYNIKNIPSKKTDVIISTVNSEVTPISNSKSDDITVIPLNSKKSVENIEAIEAQAQKNNSKILPNILEFRNNSTITNETSQAWLKNEPTRISIPLINEKAALPDSILKMTAASDLNIEDDEEITAHVIHSSTASSEVRKVSSISSESSTMLPVSNSSQVGDKTNADESINKSDKILSVPVEKFAVADKSKETLELNEEIYESEEFTTITSQHSSLMSNEDASVEVIQNDSAPVDTSSLVEIIPGFEKVTQKVLFKTSDDHLKTVGSHSPKDEVEMIKTSSENTGKSHDEMENIHEEKQKRDVVKKVLKDTFDNPKENIRTDLEETTNSSVELLEQNEEQNIVKPNDFFLKVVNATKETTIKANIKPESTTATQLILTDKSRTNTNSEKNSSHNLKVAY